MSRRVLQIVLAVLATVAVASGLSAIIAGPAVLPAVGKVNATIDSEYRFANAFWLAAGLDTCDAGSLHGSDLYF